VLTHDAKRERERERRSGLLSRAFAPAKAFAEGDGGEARIRRMRGGATPLHHPSVVVGEADEGRR
jgi:hypothetical protein